jgi:hypothetical protein
MLVKAKVSFPLCVIWKGLFDTLNLGKIHPRKLLFVNKINGMLAQRNIYWSDYMVGLYYTILGKRKHCNTSTSPHARVYKEVN